MGNAFEGPKSQSPASLREKSESSLSEKFRKDRETRAKAEEGKLVTTLESDTGQLESAIGSGNFDVRAEYTNSDGSIDDIKLEETTLKIIDSKINLEALPTDVASEIAHMIEQLLQDKDMSEKSLENDARLVDLKDTLVSSLETLNAIEKPKTEAKAEAEINIKAPDATSYIISQAEKMGYSELAGKTETEINNIKEEIALIKDDIALKSKGFFNRLKNTFKISALKKSLTFNERTIQQYNKLKADVEAQGSIKETSGDKTSSARSRFEDRRNQQVAGGIKGITK